LPKNIVDIQKERLNILLKLLKILGTDLKIILLVQIVKVSKNNYIRHPSCYYKMSKLVAALLVRECAYIIILIVRQKLFSDLYLAKFSYISKLFLKKLWLLFKCL